MTSLSSLFYIEYPCNLDEVATIIIVINSLPDPNVIPPLVFLFHKTSLFQQYWRWILDAKVIHLHTFEA